MVRIYAYESEISQKIQTWILHVNEAVIGADEDRGLIAAGKSKPGAERTGASGMPEYSVIRQPPYPSGLFI